MEDEKQAWLGLLRVVQGKPLTALSPTPPHSPNSSEVLEVD